MKETSKALFKPENKATLINKLVGANIKKARNKRGLSQSNLGDKVSLSRASIANIERGDQAINIYQLFKFSEALRVTPKTILPKYEYNPIEEYPPETRKWIEEVLKKARADEN